MTDRQQIVVAPVVGGQDAEHRRPQGGPYLADRPDPGVQGGAHPGQHDAEEETARQPEGEQRAQARPHRQGGGLGRADDVTTVGVAGPDVEDAFLQVVELVLRGGLGGRTLQLVLGQPLVQHGDLLLQGAGGPLHGGVVTDLAVGQIGLGEGVGATRRALGRTGGELEAEHLGLVRVGDPYPDPERAGLVVGPAQEARRLVGDGRAARDPLLGAHADLVVGGDADRPEGIGGGAHEDFAGGRVGVGSLHRQSQPAEQSQKDAQRDEDTMAQEPAQLVA